MLLFPNAKINLGLRVIGKRSDGFHNIETLFIPVSLSDALEFLPAKDQKTAITITGVELESRPVDNLVIKAWQLMHERFGVPPLEIHLHKIIPVGAGLGGGSADAAFMLKGINQSFDCRCSQETLEELASGIGSDCAFFIRNRPALGSGRGEILQNIELDLSGHEIMLVNPAIHISTREAYAGVKPSVPADKLTDLIGQNIESWQQTITNDFEHSVFKKYPEIRKLKEDLLESGAVYSSMSGSGSSVYGIFRKGELEKAKPSFGEWFTFTGKLGPSKL
jgi:4-diphosphocytidyl-2-C-methyl-D-erythritol kinase